MGFGLTDVLSGGITAVPDLLTPDFGPAMNTAGFNPVGVQSSIGSASFDPNSRLFSSQLSPEMQQLQKQLLQQLGQTSPDKQLGLFREQAQPFNEQMGLDIENRLFKQGLMGASSPNQPGGIRRSFFDSVANQDLQFQQLAQSQSMSDQINLLNQIFGLSGLENSLFGQAGLMSGIAGQSDQYLSGLQAQEATVMPNLFGSLLGSGIQAYGMSQGG